MPPTCLPWACTRPRIGHAVAGGRATTEDEWLACTRTNPMLRFLIGTEGRVQAMTESPACEGRDGKLRLFGTHKVLRGGARMTRSLLWRDTRRNSYRPDRRDVRSGLRTRALRS